LKNIPSAWPFSASERPRTRSIEESLAAIEAGMAKKRLRRQAQYLRRGSRAEAQESQQVATKRYDPHGYD
jgi:hypothetical protein